MPDYVGHMFALTPHRCSVPIRAPIIVAQQRRTAGTPPCRHDCLAARVTRTVDAPPCRAQRSSMTKGRSQPGSRRKRHAKIAPAAESSQKTIVEPTRVSRQQGASTTGRPSLHANRSRRAETPHAGAEVERYRANRYGCRDDDDGEMPFAIGIVGVRSFGRCVDRGPGRQRMLEECAGMRSTSSPRR